MRTGKSFPSRLLREERGEVKFLSILLVLGLVGGGVFAALYAPLWIDHLEAKKRCEETLNSTWQHKDSEVTRNAFLRKIQEIDKYQVEVDGVTETRPAVDPKHDDLRVEIDYAVDPPVLSIDVWYERVASWPLIDKQTTFSFSHRCERELAATQW